MLAQRSKSNCFDEPSHVYTGINAWAQDFSGDPANPPLAHRVNALPVKLLRVDDPTQAIWIARIPVLTAMVALGFGLFLWTRHRIGSGPAFLALGLFCTCPTMLSHGTIVIPDMLAAGLFFASILCIVPLLKAPSLPRLVIAGICLGALFSTKLTAALMLPVLCLAGLLRVLLPTPLQIGKICLQRPQQKGVALLLLMTALGTLAVLTIWVVYGFQFEISKTNPSNVRLPELLGASGSIVDRGLLRAYEYRLLPEHYLQAVYFLLRATNTAYVLGETSYQGWWWYFPFAFLVKTPIPTLVLFLTGTAVTVFSVWRHRALLQRFEGHFEMLAILLFVVVYFAGIMMSSYNVGMRHLLPLLPCLMALAAQIAVHIARTRAIAVILVALMMWNSVTFAKTFPDYLAFFNEAAGGPKEGYKYLVDSNLDWGQDLPSLKRYYEKRGSGKIWLQYFGSGSPFRFGIDFKPIVYPYGPSEPDQLPPPLAAGTFVVSVTYLFGGYILDAPYQYPFDVNTWNDLSTKGRDFEYNATLCSRAGTTNEQYNALPLTRDELVSLRGSQGIALLKGLRSRKPDERIGYTMFVFHLSDDELTRLISPASHD